jgi:DHA2 family multidrug resistance protein-like MFS transporter
MLAAPFHLQQALRQTPLMTGVYLTSWPLAVSIAALASGRLADRLPSALLCSLGASLIAGGLVCAAVLPVEAGPVWFSATIVPCGLGFGIFQVPNNRTMFLAAPVARSAAAGGMQGTARLTGQTFGSVLVTVLFVSAPNTFAPTLAMAVGAAFALTAAAVSAMQISPAPRDRGGSSANPFSCV